MQPVTVDSLLGKAAALLNDPIQSMFTDAVMLPYFDMAYGDLKLGVADYGLPINNVTSEGIEVVAGIDNIGGSGGPALPSDLIEILSMEEITSGTAGPMMLMKRLQFLPLNQVRTAYLGVWSWQNQVVKFIGATGNITVRMKYLGSTLGEITNEDTQIRMFNCQNYLIYRTAGHCAMFIGENESRAQTLYSMAEEAGKSLINIAIRSQQSVTTRRRVNNLRGRTGGYWSNR